MNHKASPFKYLLESAIIEAFDLPKVTPEYKVMSNNSKEIVTLIKSIDTELYITKKDTGAEWVIGFNNTKSKSELSGKFNFKVIPGVISVVKDLIDKASSPPFIISFIGKKEDNKKDELVSRRGNIYKNLIRRYWPDAAIDKDEDMISVYFKD